MIPISRDVHLKFTSDDVIYEFLPPVEDVEAMLYSHLTKSNDVDWEKEEAYYQRALKDLSSKLVGMKKTNPKHQKLVVEKINEYKAEDASPKLSTREENNKTMDDLLSLVLVGWSSKKHKDLPDFNPKSPTSGLRFTLKTELYDWYLNEFLPDTNDVKN